jgi:hypothetical protein
MALVYVNRLLSIVYQRYDLRIIKLHLRTNSLSGTKQC